MEHKFARLISLMLCKNGVITKEHEVIYTYGLELIISFISTSIIILILGLICNRLLQSIFFISIFVFLRRFTGGYHADTHLKCKLCTIGIFLINLLFVELLNITLITFVIFSLFSLIIILIFAPIENKNKPIPQTKHKRIKFLATVSFITLDLIGLILFSFKPLSNSILLALLSVIALMLIEKFKERRLSKHEKA